MSPLDQLHYLFHLLFQTRTLLYFVIADMALIAVLFVIQGETVVIVVRTQVVVENFVNRTIVADKIIHLIVNGRNTGSQSGLRL